MDRARLRKLERFEATCLNMIDLPPGLTVEISKAKEIIHGATHKPWIKEVVSYLLPLFRSLVYITVTSKNVIATNLEFTIRNVHLTVTKSGLDRIELYDGAELQNVTYFHRTALYEFRPYQSIFSIDARKIKSFKDGIIVMDSGECVLIKEDPTNWK